MRVVVLHRGCETAVEVEADPDTPVRELATALGDAATTDLAVEGRRAPAATPVGLAGLRDGATVRPLAPDDSDPGLLDDVLAGPDPAGVVVELHVTGGVTAGARHPVRPGTHVIGRGRAADVALAHATVSSRHARLEVAEDGTCTLTDLGSRNGTWLDGAPVTRPVAVGPDDVIVLGACELRLRPPRVATTAPVVPPPGATRVPFNRPPRPPAPPAIAPVAVPATPTSAAPATRLAWPTLLAPLVVGAAMALLVEPVMALFALLSPVALLAGWADDRRRARRDRRRDREDRARDLATLERALAATRRELVARLDVTLPDPAEVVARAVSYDTRLWAARPGAEDALRLRLGTGTVDLALPLDLPPEPDPAGLDAAHRAARAGRVPVGLDLARDRSVGLVGAPEATAPVLRSLVAAATTLHGPADLRIVVLTDRPTAWAWARWLPHLQAPATADPDVATEAVTAATDVAAWTLLVVDAPALVDGHDGRTRELLRHSGVSGVVATTAASRLPDRCAEVVIVDQDGCGTHLDVTSGRHADDLLVAGIDEATALRVARALAGLDDPEVRDPAGALPRDVALLDLLDLAVPSAGAVAARWRDAGDRVAGPVGVGRDGVLHLDLDRHGPHGLVGGTTGSGKSELLRTVVASLAASASPEHLNLVLVDYKGGAAFDACADLPHTVGVVTDLDEHLAARALTCLEAELRWRERRLRQAGASDLAGYLAAGPERPLPRLLLVIDELAALTAELPEFVTALVDIAQRGRSLGVHLLLATQRPTGVVSDPVRANTDLRIALRVQDEHDSLDVVGVRDAAHLGRDLPGRGLVRLGPDPAAPFQTASISGRTSATAARVRVRPLGAPVPVDPTAEKDGSGTDLDRLVRACREAAAHLPPPRRPWPPVLPTALHPSDLPPAEPGRVVLGLVDRPEEQVQEPLEVDLAAGPVVLVGPPASGPADALVTAALSLATSSSPDDVHLHVLDLGTTGLRDLAALPHVGAYVTAGERERQHRLLRMLTAEVETRRALAGQPDGPDLPRIVLLLDGYSAFSAAYDDVASYRLREGLERVIAEGAPLGVTTLLTADRSGAVPVVVAAAAGRTLAFGPAEDHDVAVLGRSHGPAGREVVGRGIDARSRHDVQVAVATPEERRELIAEVARRVTPTSRPPATVGTLASEVRLDEVGTAADPTSRGGGWRIALGLADEDLGPAVLELGSGDHALVAGPARSGRSTTLATLATTAVRARPDLTLTVVTPRPSAAADVPGATVVGPDELARRCEELRRTSGPHLVLVDDAELVRDEAGALSALLAERRPDLHVVAAGRVDVLRASFEPWLVELRRTRTGIALRPDPDRDGALWETTLPRRGPDTWPAGRGYLLQEGRPSLVQVAVP